MRIEEVSVKRIRVGERFRVEMGELETLSESIKDKGLIQPISVAISGGPPNDRRYKLLAGGRRLEACKQIGLDTIPVVIRETPGELDEREIELIENTERKDLTWSERAMLEGRIYDLYKEKDPKWTLKDQAATLDVSKGTVSRRLELAVGMETIPELADCRTEDEAWKKWQRLKEGVVMEALKGTARDAYAKARKYAEDHYIIGDALDRMPKVHSDIVSFAEVDPPYAISIDKRKARSEDTSDSERYTEIAAKEYPKFLSATASEVHRILRANTYCVWWFGMTWYTLVKRTLEKAGFKVNDIPAVWIKGGSGQVASPDTTLGSTYEPFFVCRKGLPKLNKAGRSNVFQFSPVAPQQKIHSTERPVDLMGEILDTFAYPGSIIMSPFLGSGSILRAAYTRDMTGFGYDLDEAIKRRFIGRVQEDMLGEGEGDG